MDPTGPKAVFLSYASQDVEAARRIADALRAFGMEVWFDQHELRGGDSWDQKIRTQIRECALFLPMISTTTQQRGEGYFRREWLLAVERTRDMAEGVPFIVPVVVDDIPETAAAVPEPFLRVQWTRLPHGVPSPQFVDQVKRLLEAPRTPPAARAGQVSDLPYLSAPPRSGTTRRFGMPGWSWGALAVVVAVGTVVWFTARQSESPAATLVSGKSIAVLPFENLGAEPDGAHFADGMHDEVLTALVKVAALKVIGRTSVLPYRDPTLRNLRKISAELNVGSVVEGTVRRAGNRVRIAVQLVDAQTSRLLWGDSYERELTDMFAIQAAVAQEIVTTLRATLTAGERASLERQLTKNAQAYECYLQAKLLTNDLSNTAPLKEWDRAVKMLEEAVVADPGFAQAHALLARTHASIYWYGSLDPSSARRELARQSLAAAKRLAPAAAETRFAEGRFAYTSNHEFAEAMRHYTAARAEMPNDSELLNQLGLTHRQLGRLAEGAAALAHAHALNPLDLQNAQDLIASLLMLRRFLDAATVGERYTGNTPESAYILRHAAFARFELDGDRAQFVRRLRTRPAPGDDPHRLTPSFEAALYAGDLTEAARVLADSRFITLLSNPVTLAEPVALHRALLARLLDQRAAAVAHASEAISYFRSRAWTQRQQPVVALSLVRTATYAGQKAEALRLATELRRELGGKNGIDEVSILNELGRVYALLDARDEAFAVLHTLMTGPSSPFFGAPRIIRIDPCWSLIAEDPRFDEILKAAKPL